MKNYICIDGKKIEISQETAHNLTIHVMKDNIRHGDYGVDNDGERLLIECGEKPPVVCELLSRNEESVPCGSIRGGQHNTRNFTILGNVFDDIKAIIGDAADC